MEWQKGEILFERCVDKVRELQGQGYVFRAIFWYQGERDSPNPVIAYRWKQLFYRIINNFKRDTGIKNVPIILAQLGRKPLQDGRAYWHVIQTQQRLAVQRDNFYLIQTRDIRPYCPYDGVHFCPEGYSEIAQRFISRFEEVVK